MTTSAAGLLNTSTVINLPRLADATALPDVPLISTITLADLSVGPLVAASVPNRQAILQQAESDFDPLSFDAAAARAFGRVTAALRRNGRKPQARSYDAMIAAVAVCPEPARAHQQSR